MRRLIAQSRHEAAEQQTPINIHINLGDGAFKAPRRKDRDGFDLLRSKLFWIIVALSLSMTAAYARTRYVCQSFKDNGRFFYGMGVDRCIGVLIKQPFERVGVQLDLINRSY
ncbi:hypothetical protein [Methylobacterium haplocladii]|uniref:hypothetical protein n=1 Tax=Methylobacterium haplocladii TaxID=1176176 RepID=UPI0024E15FF3|nr:hypothetical protein [Methylobacterium haplocladii]